MAKGEVCLARFPLGGTVGVKVRPVVLLTDWVGPVPEFLTAYGSSVIPDPLLPSDIVLDPSISEHASSGLKGRTVIRLHKMSTVHRRDVLRRLGVLSATTLQEIDTRLRVLLGL